MRIPFAGQATGGAAPRGAELAAFIDHTLLKPEATASDIRRLCAEAREHRFRTVCVNPVWVPLARRELEEGEPVAGEPGAGGRAAGELAAGGAVGVCTVVGFPLGATPSENKAAEARRALTAGAREIDMVMNIGALKGGDDDVVLHDMQAVVEVCRQGGALCKVILETALLDEEEKRRACRLAVQARADFVKTSTGFGPGGATEADVALLAAEAGAAGLGVKAAGGVRTADDARRMIAAGATRIGTSAGVRIVTESSAR